MREREFSCVTSLIAPFIIFKNKQTNKDTLELKSRGVDLRLISLEDTRVISLEDTLQLRSPISSCGVGLPLWYEAVGLLARLPRRITLPTEPPPRYARQTDQQNSNAKPMSSAIVISVLVAVLGVKTSRRSRKAHGKLRSIIAPHPGRTC